MVVWMICVLVFMGMVCLLILMNIGWVVVVVLGCLVSVNMGISVSVFVVIYEWNCIFVFLLNEID